MTTIQWKSRVAELEAELTQVRQQLDYAETVAGIKRGLAEADQGLGIPARQWAKKIRRKLKLPSS